MEQNINISICIPTYNRSDLLKKTLISVVRQTVKPYEVIVVDNCSEDDTEAVVKPFETIIYYRNECNLGLAGNWNHCIKVSHGNFLTILHSDDLIAPTWYEEMQKIITKYINSNIGVFFLPVFTIDLKENTKIVYYSLSDSILLKAAESIRILWSKNMCALPASGGIVFRKSIFNEIGMFDESYTTETDTLTVLRILNQYPVYYYKKLLYAYRIHPFQTFDKEKQIKSLEKKYRVLINHLKMFKNFYNNELKQACKQPFFYKRLVYMYLAISVFNLLTFKIKIGKRYYQLIKESLPDITISTFDYLMVFSVILHYFYKLIVGRILSLPIKTVARDWIKNN